MAATAAERLSALVCAAGACDLRGGGCCSGAAASWGVAAAPGSIEPTSDDEKPQLATRGAVAGAATKPIWRSTPSAAAAGGDILEGCGIADGGGIDGGGGGGGTDS